MMKRCLVLYFLITSFYFSAQQNIDSLVQKAKTANDDTTKLDLYLILVEQHPDEKEWKKYNELAFKLASQLANSGNKRIRKRGNSGLSSVYNNKGFIEINKGNTLLALDFFEKALDLKIKNDDSTGLADVYSNIGATMDRIGKLEKALDYYLKALNLRETQKNPELKGTILGNIGSVYNNLEKHQKALDYFLEEIQLKSKSNSPGLGLAYSNIAPIYRNLKKYPEAFGSAYKALALAKQTKDTFLENEAYSRLADFYATSKQYDSALYYSQKSISLSTKSGNLATVAEEYNNIGYINFRKKNFKEAETFLLSAFRIFDSLNTFYQVKSTADILCDLYDSIKDYKKALVYYKIKTKINEKIFRNENKEALIKLTVQLEFDKKTAIIKEEQEQERVIAKEKNQQQKIIIWSVGAGLILVFLFSIFIFSRLQITRKQKLVIESQKSETEKQKYIIEEQKRIVDEKQNEIIASINYAQRIQSAVLTGDEVWKKISKEYFIIFQPRDIVSGDFYWAHVLSNGRAVFALADCTGHGVPGGFMSMLGNSFLNELVVENKLFKADEILNRLRDKVIAALFQKGQTQQKDGMDMILCVWNKMDNTLEFAGANNALYIVRDKEITEYKGDKMPIGSYLEENKKFTSQKITLQTNDVIYLSTDGFADQFGGEKGKKFRSKQFEELLVEVSNLTVEEQKQKLIDSFAQWRKNFEQTDDVSLIGIKVI